MIPIPAFRPQNPLAQVRAGGGGGDSRDFESAGRRLDPPAGEQPLDPAIARRLLAGRARCDPAAEGRVVEALRIVAEHEVFGAQLRFEVRARHPGLEGCKLRQRIEPDEPPKPRHHDGE